MASVVQANEFKRVSGGNRTLIDGHTLNYRKGQDWYVDASRSGSGSGKAFDDAFSTMAQAFASIGSGDSIYVVGKVVEQLVTPVNVFDVRVVGMGTRRPRHADAAPVGGNTNTAQWAPPASGGVAAQATVRVLQQGWEFDNILFTAIDANAAMVELVRNSGAGNAERDASHAALVGCRFAGAGKGIRVGATSFAEVVNHVLVEDCRFDTNTFGIHGTIIGNYWSIRYNEWRDCTNNLTAAMGLSHIYDNIFGLFTDGGVTGGIDLRGGVGENVVTKNYLSGVYSHNGGYQEAAATDEWAGNFNSLSGGITAALPT